MNPEKIKIAIERDEDNREHILKKVGEKALEESVDKRDDYEIVPEGYFTLRAFAKKIGISVDVVESKIQELGIERTKYRNEKGRLWEYLSLEQQQQILDSLDYLILAEEAPEGYLTTPAFAKKVRISADTIERKVQELGIEKARYKSETGQLREFLSPGQQRQIIDSLEHLISAEEAPEGYLTTPAFAKKIGISNPAIESKIQELGIERVKYKHESGQLCEFLSPEQQRQILDSLEHLVSAEEVPEGYLTAKAFARKMGISRPAIESKIQELGIERAKYKHQKGRLCEFLSPEQQQQILDSLDYLISAEEAPEGYLTTPAFAKKVRISADTIERKVQELGIERAKYKHESGQLCEFLSPEQQQQILDSLEHLVSAEEVPEGYLTLRAFAKKIGISVDVVESKIQELGIERAKFKNETGHLRAFLSQEQQQQIIDSLDYLISAEEAPEGYLTTPAFAEKMWINVDTIERKIQELGLDRAKYRNEKGRLCEFLSPKQQQQIIDSLDYLISAEEAPEGHLTLSAFAEKMGIGRYVTEKRIQKLGIEKIKYKNRRGQLREFLSPEQQAFIIENLEDSSSGTSIPENTIAFYLEKAGQEIEQGLRPNWLKNPESGRNLEVDIFVDPPGIGIEYDGMYWHQDIERDIRKDNIARESGYNIIHIREDGCPELPEGSYCIKRKDNNDDIDLGECIKKCFEMIGISMPDVDVVRDKKDIMAFMRQKMRSKLDLAGTFDELVVAS